MFGNGGNLPFKGRFREEDWGGGNEATASSWLSCAKMGERETATLALSSGKSTYRQL